MDVAKIDLDKYLRNFLASKIDDYRIIGNDKFIHKNLLQLIEALIFIKTKNIHHLDIKPQNIMIVESTNA